LLVGQAQYYQVCRLTYKPHRGRHSKILWFRVDEFKNRLALTKMINMCVYSWIDCLIVSESCCSSRAVGRTIFSWMWQKLAAVE
jgi:hypothetical protein